MQVGLVSDTHGYFHPELRSCLSGMDLIIHAGDVGSMSVLLQLREIARTEAVFGNIDGPDIRQLTDEYLDLTIEGFRFLVTHIGGRPGNYAAGLRHRLEAEAPDVVVCGHSHILSISRDASLGGMLFINPGAAGRQGLHLVKTCVRLKLSSSGLEQAEVVHLDGPVESVVGT